MNNFNIRSFCRTAGWTALTTRKEIITNSGSMLFAFLVPLIIHTVSSYGRPGYYVANSLTSALQMCFVLYFIFTTIGGCWIFSNMKTKEQRITFKMLPASDLEKFLVRFLYVTVVWSLMGFAAFCLADLLRILISLIAGADWVKCIIPDFPGILFSSTGEHAGSKWNISLDMTALSAMVIAWGFWVHSFYLLGGAFFRRRQFMLSSCAMLLLLILFSFTLSKLEIFSIGHSITTGNVNTLAYIATVALSAATLLDWWLAYRIFKRMQVINNKWINA